MNINNEVCQMFKVKVYFYHEDNFWSLFTFRMQVIFLIVSIVSYIVLESRKISSIANTYVNQGCLKYSCCSLFSFLFFSRVICSSRFLFLCFYPCSLFIVSLTNISKQLCMHLSETVHPLIFQMC